MDEAALLLSQYCDNELSPEDESALVRWLKSDAAHVERFVHATHLHSLVYDLVREQHWQSTAWSHTLGENEPYPQIKERQSARAVITGNGRFWKAAAALLMIVAGVVAIASSLNGPKPVAQVSNLHGAAVTSKGATLLAGAFLPAGETLRVNEGQLVVTFQCGARVLLEAPALFVVETDSAGSLIEGLASAQVPTQAIGFSIRTTVVKVIDMGTEFLLKIIDDDQVELHVFDGLVETRLDNRFKHAKDAPLRISEGRSTLFDLGTNEIVTLEYDESLKRKF